MEAELPRTDQSLPIALIRAREVLMAPIREMLAESGLTEQQWRILRVLKEGGPMDARAISKLAAISAPSVSRILVALEDRELILRRGDSKDRRRQVISIASAGDYIIQRNISSAKKRAIANRERLGAEKYDTLLTLLAEISSWPENPR